MARKPTFRKSAAIVAALRDPTRTSRFLALQLVASGYLTVCPVHLAKRGRPAHSYALTGKARGLLALAANWGKRNHYLRQNLKPVAVDNAEVTRYELAA
jgi:predicted ArsR family transcriptional regulator